MKNSACKQITKSKILRCMELIMFFLISYYNQTFQNTRPTQRGLTTRISVTLGQPRLEGTNNQTFRKARAIQRGPTTRHSRALRKPWLLAERYGTLVGGRALWKVWFLAERYGKSGCWPSVAESLVVGRGLRKV